MSECRIVSFLLRQLREGSDAFKEAEKVLFFKFTKLNKSLVLDAHKIDGMLNVIRVKKVV